LVHRQANEHSEPRSPRLDRGTNGRKVEGRHRHRQGREQSNGRPVIISSSHLSDLREQFLGDRLEKSDFNLTPLDGKRSRTPRLIAMLNVA